MALLPVADALEKILHSVSAPLSCEFVAIEEAAHRTLGAPLAALRTQPPFPVSSMDGYAVRSGDTTRMPSHLRLIGESAAGEGFSGSVGPQQCVRIFTGAPLPDGADAVIAQEDAQRDGAFVVFQEIAAPGKFVRRAGLDFSSGDILLATGTRLHARAVGLAAAMGHAHVPVRRKPKCALIATGDELVRPGFQTGPDQIILSNTYAIAALIHDAGGEAMDCGIVRDDEAELGNAIRKAQAAGADILITTGGASVGERDFVQAVLAREGMDLNFWKIAMRPGKPLLHGVMGGMQILGLPGNPVSSFVCAHIFLMPLIRALLGDPQAGADRTETAILDANMPANDMREDYVRASLSRDAGGTLVATPAAAQDSSMLRLLCQSDALIIRAAHAPAASRGDRCRILRL
ncbi:MAG: molybdopterin molybdotransferase MoeA [Beijerinckiaceae bacterium]